MKPPKLIHVGPSTLDVTLVKGLDLLGEFTDHTDEILLRAGMAPGCERDTLVHELLHAIIFASGYAKVADLNHDSEERLVSVLSPWILALVRDNPRLVTYLTSKKRTADGSGSTV